MNIFGWSPWTALLASVLLMASYELWYHACSRRFPLRFARTTHARIRSRWAQELMQLPGSELLAIQTIRNSVMSSTVTASTAVLALMGLISLLGNRAEHLAMVPLSPRAVLAALLIVILFAAFVFSVMAVRFFNHAGYLMGSQARDETRAAYSAMAAQYMVRAGNYYSQGMRTLLWLTPVAVGGVNPWFMPGAAVALLGVMVWFDRSPQAHDIPESGASS